MGEMGKGREKNMLHYFLCFKNCFTLCWVFQLVKNFDETCDANEHCFAMFAIVRFRVRLKDLMCLWVGSLACYAAWMIWHLERICRTNDSM
jgi:hypothetical protein